MATENPDNEEATKTEDMSSFNPIDCPAGGPVFSDQASEEACPVCKEVEVDAKAGDNGIRKGEKLRCWRLWVGSRTLIDMAESD